MTNEDSTGTVVGSKHLVHDNNVEYTDTQIASGDTHNDIVDIEYR